MINLLLQAIVVPTPTPTPNIDSMLTNALSIASGLPGIFGAIFVGLIVLAWAALKISKYFEDRGKREKDSYLEDQRIKQIQAENTAKMQNDAVKALLDNMDISYKQDYEYFVKMINEKKYSAIYAKISPIFKEQIATFIYDETLTSEFRAGRVIQTVRKI